MLQNIKKILDTDKRFKLLKKNFYNYKSKPIYAILNSLGDKELLDSLQDADANFANSIILKDSRTTKACIFKTGSNDIFLKRYNNKGFAFTLRYLFRRARAFRAWESAFLLKELDIPTPEPLIAIEYKNGLILKKGFLYTECIENIISQDQFYKECIKNKDLLAEFAKTAAGYLFKMHSNGIFHGDFKLHNIYIQKNENNNYKFGLWDLDSVKKKSLFASREKLEIKDLERLVRSFKEIKEALNISDNDALDIQIPLYQEYLNISLKYYKQHNHAEVIDV